jgi:hypothetical protein
MKWHEILPYTEVRFKGGPRLRVFPVDKVPGYVLLPLIAIDTKGIPRKNARAFGVVDLVDECVYRDGVRLGGLDDLTPAKERNFNDEDP